MDTVDADDPLSVGFIGYRFMGEAHANALARLPMFFPEAPAVERDVLVGTDESALGTAAGRLGFERYATDWREVVDEVDVLYNLGPNWLHVEPSVAALEAGTHVLCEKPLAPTTEGAERMVAAADASDAVAACGFTYRFVPALQYARGLIRSGELGEIRQFRGHYLQDWLVADDAPWSWRLDADAAGSGALGDLGAHTVDIANFLVGGETGPITRVSGHLRTFVEERPVDGNGDGGGRNDDTAGSGPTDATRPVTVDDAFSAQLAFESGAMGTVEASRVASAHVNDHHVAVHGSDGSLRFSLERLNELQLHRGGDRGYETILVTGEDDPYLDHWWPPGHVLGWEHAFVHENAEFLSAVAGDDEFAPDFADALGVQRVLDGVAESDERGEWVAVDAGA